MQRSAIVIVADRLGAGFLGPYGNTWLETPALNRLAAQSLLGEQVLADSPNLEAVYRSYWQGRHAGLSPPESPAILGGDTEATRVLLTNEPRIAAHPLAQQFHTVIAEQPASPDCPADEVEQTQTAQLFAAAIDWLEQSATTPFLLWLHVRAMEGPWDAPLALRNQFADEDDPPPSDAATPPNRVLPRDFDPDELLPFQHAYAGQVAVFDACLEAFLDAVAMHPAAREALLLLTSPRGFPLGEHGRLGPCDEALYGELLQVPLLVRFPDGIGAARRTQGLLQPPDVYATLCDWQRGSCDVPELVSLYAVARGADVRRDRVYSCGSNQRAIRTPAWFLRQGPDSAVDLFCKPDDRWEANEVSRRGGEVVEQLLAAADDWERNEGQAERMSPLSEMLVEGLD